MLIIWLSLNESNSPRITLLLQISLESTDATRKQNRRRQVILNEEPDKLAKDLRSKKKNKNKEENKPGRKRPIINLCVLRGNTPFVDEP